MMDMKGQVVKTRLLSGQRIHPLGLELLARVDPGTACDGSTSIVLAGRAQALCLLAAGMHTEHARTESAVCVLGWMTNDKTGSCLVMAEGPDWGSGLAVGTCLMQGLGIATVDSAACCMVPVRAERHATVFLLTQVAGTAPSVA